MPSIVSSLGEPRGTVRIRHRTLRPLVLTPEDVPALIDELPALAALATAGGELHVTGAAELRVKESDRITALAAGLRALGADVDEFPDGFHIRGARPLAGGYADAAHDHRLAMAFAIAGLAATGPTTIARRRRRGRLVSGLLRHPGDAARVPTDKVYLVGFMGAGKSTLARSLGARLDWRVEDVDERIEAREGRSVSAIFAAQGEPYFRQVERRVLLDLLPLRHVVVATGGGTFADPDNRALINRDGALGLARRAAAGDRRPHSRRRPPAAGRRPRRSSSASTTRGAPPISKPTCTSMPATRAVDALVEQLLDRLEA